MCVGVEGVRREVWLGISKFRSGKIADDGMVRRILVGRLKQKVSKDVFVRLGYKNEYIGLEVKEGELISSNGVDAAHLKTLKEEATTQANALTPLSKTDINEG